MTEREFEALHDYSCSVPTGTTIGKVWRRREPYRADQLRPGEAFQWYLGEYVVDRDPKYVGILWRKIVIGEPPKDGSVPPEPDDMGGFGDGAL